MDEKRLFFGAEVAAPWPESWPPGRIIEETSRHITLAFLGNVDAANLRSSLHSLPLPSFQIGLSGKTNGIVFFPKRKPRVAATEISWLTRGEEFGAFQSELILWLQSLGLNYSAREERHPHLTIARAPFNQSEWELVELEIPLFLKAIHLYESTGNLTYQPLWSHPFTAPFDEIEHTADIAYHIRGKDVREIHTHAQIALAFTSPTLLKHFSQPVHLDSLGDIIMDLNRLISVQDQESGSPFKAVSYHSTLRQIDHNLIEWEMIVDV